MIKLKYSLLIFIFIGYMTTNIATATVIKWSGFVNEISNNSDEEASYLKKLQMI